MFYSFLLHYMARKKLTYLHFFKLLFIENAVPYSLLFILYHLTLLLKNSLAISCKLAICQPTFISKSASKEFFLTFMLEIFLILIST